MGSRFYGNKAFRLGRNVFCQELYLGATMFPENYGFNGNDR